MAVDTTLGAPVSLGRGQTMRPPSGWLQTGWITNDGLGLLPKTRVYWGPDRDSSVKLHYQLSRAALPPRMTESLVQLLEGDAGPVPLDSLKTLMPGLIRMRLSSLRAAEVVAYPQSWPFLRVDYSMTDFSLSGIVHYSPTEFYKRGEYQILAYEGPDPEYQKHLAVAMAAMATFSVETT